MQVRGLRALQLAVTPNRTQIVHLPTGFFRPRFLLQINLSSFLQEWLAFCAGEEGVAGFLCLCPEGSTHLDTVSPGVLACVRCRPWGDGSGTGWGSGGIMMPGHQPAVSMLAQVPGFLCSRSQTLQQLSEAAVSSLWMGFKPRPCNLGGPSPPEPTFVYTCWR